MNCVAITKNLEPCKNNRLDGSFFCGLHKRNLYNVSEFHLLHSGPIDEILKVMSIKTSEETKKGTLSYPYDIKGRFYKRKGKLRVRTFSQVFFQLVFPKGFVLNKYEQYEGAEKNKTIEINLNILKPLSKLENFEAHFVPIGFAYGLCRSTYCVVYDITKSVKENLNMMYYYWVSQRIENLKEYNIGDLKAFRKEVFENPENMVDEFVINMSVPLEINGKNYIKKIFN